MPRRWWSGCTARVGDVGAADVGVRHEPVAVEDADGAGRDVVARALPVTDDVLERDVRLAEVDDLLGRDHLVDRLGVVEGQRAGGEPVRQVERCGAHDAPSLIARLTHTMRVRMPTFS